MQYVVLKDTVINGAVAATGSLVELESGEYATRLLDEGNIGTEGANASDAPLASQPVDSDSQDQKEAEQPAVESQAAPQEPQGQSKQPTAEQIAEDVEFAAQQPNLGRQSNDQPTGDQNIQLS